MAKAKVYLKSGQCFDVVAEEIACKYGTLNGKEQETTNDNQ